MSNFENNLLAIYGAKSSLWLKQFPETVTKFIKQWQLSNLVKFDNLSYNYVLSGYKEQQAIVLKLGLDYDAISHEARVLDCFSNHAVVKVLAKDAGAILLQRAIPGISLQEFSVTDKSAKYASVVN